MYLTELPPLKLLEARLHEAIEHAREQAARRGGYPEAESEVVRHIEETPETRPKRKKADKRARGDA